MCPLFSICNCDHTAPDAPGFYRCELSDRCRPGPRYSRNYARELAERGLAAVPVFAEPHVFRVNVKTKVEVAPDGIHEIQTWHPWQVCTNCLYLRRISACSLRRDSLLIMEPAWRDFCGIGEESEEDLRFGPDSIYGAIPFRELINKDLRDDVS
ncbi:uncharacterized protein K441DRAFT_682656 [Cenococcum geophilum 1.58]|uniref:Uncharacterized protein n=1 Tax=Cenococcum geophilum 1.58 TaxID=794803 RepID=A0ACC8EPD1_9PEZI|nr:hypothetical protein K441DRAFT_682656 [Cenococcum geophilum 1.58]